MEQALPALAGILAGIFSALPLAWALIRAARGHGVDMLVGLTSVILAFVVAQALLAIAYVTVPVDLATFGIALAASFLLATVGLGLAAWGRSDARR